CLWVDIRVFATTFPEVSLTEVVQESVLAVIVLVHLPVGGYSGVCNDIPGSVAHRSGPGERAGRYRAG
ncbi:hypothetical protein PXJ25_28455, partial [Klebsiella pneumoniae]